MNMILVPPRGTRDTLYRILMKMAPRPMPAYYLCLYLFVGLTILLAGEFIFRKKVLDLNPCQMTYSKVQLKEVAVDSALVGMKLYKYKPYYKLSKKAKVILFIPGHRGGPKQIRSIASSMLNRNGEFFFYVLDFKLFDSAYHASSILRQAIFLNDALKKIVRLHTKQETERVDVTILAHSIGGITARTAMILDNHPQCIVKNMILLSSPNSSPPYSFDPSNSILYNAVNKAWQSSYFNDSSTAKKCSEADSIAEEKYYSTASASGAVKAFWDCTPCVRQVRVISITGGEIDDQVSPELVDLTSLSPYPKNLTLLTGVSRKSRLDKGGRKSSKSAQSRSPVTRIQDAVYASFISYAVSPIYSISSWFVQFANSSSANKNINNNSSLNTTSSSVSLDESSHANGSSSSSNTNGILDRMRLVTEDDWQADIMPYIEPQLYTVRTSQLSIVGHPVDHQAMLGCYGLLRQVAWAMHMMTTDEKTEARGVEDSWLDPNLALNLTEPIPFAGRFHRRDAEASCAAASAIAIADTRTPCSSSSGGQELPLEKPPSPSTENVPIAHSFIAQSMSAVIAPIAWVMHRNHSLAFFKIAARKDYEFIRNAIMSPSRGREDAATTPRGTELKPDGVADSDSKTAPLSSSSDYLLGIKGTFGLVSVVFVTSKLATIVTAYAITSILILMYPLLCAITKHAAYRNNRAAFPSFLTLMMPINHFGVNIIFLSPCRRLRQAALLSAEEKSFFDRLALILIIIVAFVLLAISAYKLIVSPLYYVDSIFGGIPVNFIAAFSCALTLRLLLAGLVVAIRWIYCMSYRITRTVLRWTVWCRPVRRAVRSLWHGESKTAKMTKSDSDKIGNSWFSGPILFGLLVSAVVLSSWHRLSGSGHPNIIMRTLCSSLRISMTMANAGYSNSTALVTGFDVFVRAMETPVAVGFGTYWLSVFSVTLYSMLLLALFAHMFHISPSASSTSPATVAQKTASLSSLLMFLSYCPAVLLAWPSFRYALMLLYAPSHEFAALLGVADILGPERVHFVLALAAAVSHLFTARKLIASESSGGSMYPKLSPVDWAVSIFGPESALADSINDALFSKSLNSSITTESTCVHEDGGRWAVYERIRDGDEDAYSPSHQTVRTVAPGVLLGPTYRVVSCNCFFDGSFKNASEWCEWCRCSRCGGNIIPKDHWSRKETGSGSSSDSSSGGSDPTWITPQLLLLVFLVTNLTLTSTYLASMDCFLYSLGLLSFSFVAVRIVFKE